MKAKLPLYLCLLLTQCSGCNSEDPAPKPPVNQVDLLPPATQTGQRTFGCLLNGQAWNLAGNPFGGPLFSAQYYMRHLTLAASGTSTNSANGVKNGGVIQIDISNITTSGRYLLIRNDTSFVNYGRATLACQYYTDATHPATIDITRLDLVNRIVAGRFSFTLETPTCDKVIVTEGRFDSRF